MTKANEASGAAKNTDREIWRKVPDDYYSPSIHVTEGEGIGLNVGGTVIVKPIEDWFKLAAATVAREPERGTCDNLSYLHVQYTGHHPCTNWKPLLSVEPAQPRPRLGSSFNDTGTTDYKDTLGISERAGEERVDAAPDWKKSAKLNAERANKYARLFGPLEEEWNDVMWLRNQLTMANEQVTELIEELAHQARTPTQGSEKEKT